MSAQTSRDADLRLLRPSGAPSANKRASMTDGVLALLTSVTRHTTAATTASAIADELVELLGARCGAVYFADAGEGILTLAGSRNMRDAPSPLGIYDRDVREPAALAARIRRLYVAAKGQRGDDTIVAVPLVSRKRLLGVVLFELAMPLDAAAFEALSSLAVVLSTIVDRVRREEEARAGSEWRSLVAHELRQPLSAMSLQVQLILAAVGESAVAGKLLHRMGRTIARLNRLVGDLSDAALVDIRRVPLHRAPTDLVALVSSLADRGEPATSRAVEIAVRGEIPRLSLDGDRICQILTNLLTNAEKYGLAGVPIQVVIERRNEDVLVSVTNQGPAIPEDQQARLFERFYRAHGGKTDGLGVGLYVCRGLVEAHGGTVSVRSRDGSTTFRVTLPLPKGSPSVAWCGRVERTPLAAD